MGKEILKTQKVYFHGWDLSGDLKNINLRLATEAKDTTLFGHSSINRLAGLRSFSLGFSGLIEPGDNEIDDVLFDNLAVADRVATVAAQAGAEGEIAYCAREVAAAYELGGVHGDPFGFSCAMFGNDIPIVRGTIMGAGAKTATGNGTARLLRPAVVDSEQGNLSYTTEGEDDSFTDDGQDFTDWQSATANADYLVMIVNDDTTITWGYLGAIVSATEIKVYQDAALTTSGWNGQDPSAKTPSTYEIWKAGRSLYAILHVLAVSGTNPTLDVIIRSDDDVGMGSPITKITFTQAAAIGAQWATPVSADIVDTYFQAHWTIGGTDDPTFTIAVIAAVQ